MFRNAKILLYFNQFYVIRLGEKIYKYNPKLESFAIIRAFVTLLAHALKSKPTTTKHLSTSYNQLVYVETINQKNALIDIFLNKNNKEETLFMLNDINGKLEIPDYDQQSFPKKRSFCKALYYFPKAVLISRKYIKEQKGKVNKVHVLINLSLFMASVKLFQQELKKYSVQQVILANDHNLHTLALLLAAKNLRIKNYYIQHASVSPAFPKLLPEICLLEGQQASDVYHEIGNLSKKIHFVGIPRLDGILNYKKTLNTTDITVGFCLKPYYSEDLIQQYVETIRSLKNVKKIILRPHPGDGVKFYDKLKKHQIEISNARNERPHEFIKKLDVMISGESSIILESALMKVKTIYMDDEVAQYDLYGFVKNGIATPVASFDDLSRELLHVDFQKVEEQFNNCKYYCSTVNTADENRSKELILKILSNDR